MGRSIFIKDDEDQDQRDAELVFYVCGKIACAEFFVFNRKRCSEVRKMILNRLSELHKEMEEKKIECYVGGPKGHPGFERDSEWWFGNNFSDDEIVNLKYQTLLAFLNVISQGSNGIVAIENDCY